MVLARYIRIKVGSSACITLVHSELCDIGQMASSGKYNNPVVGKCW